MDREEIRYLLGSTIYARAKAYENRVQDLECETAENGVRHLSADVRGSGRNLYRTQVWLRQNGSFVSASCTCLSMKTAKVPAASISVRCCCMRWMSRKKRRSQNRKRRHCWTSRACGAGQNLRKKPQPERIAMSLVSRCCSAGNGEAMNRLGCAGAGTSPGLSGGRAVRGGESDGLGRPAARLRGTGTGAHSGLLRTAAAAALRISDGGRQLCRKKHPGTADGHRERAERQLRQNAGLCPPLGRLYHRGTENSDAAPPPAGHGKERGSRHRPPDPQHRKWSRWNVPLSGELLDELVALYEPRGKVGGYALRKGLPALTLRVEKKRGGVHIV